MATELFVVLPIYLFSVYEVSTNVSFFISDIRSLCFFLSFFSVNLVDFINLAKIFLKNQLLVLLIFCIFLFSPLIIFALIFIICCFC